MFTIIDQNVLVHQDFCLTQKEDALLSIEFAIMMVNVHLKLLVFVANAKIHVTQLNLVASTLCVEYWIHCQLER